MRILRTISAVIAALSLLLSTSVPVNAHQISSYTQRTGDGVAWGQWRIQYSSTYDGDGIIAAKVRDVHTDLSCVWAVYEDGGEAYHQARSCRGWTNHLFFDQTGDSDAWLWLNRPRFADLEILVHISGY